jgi:hypothetical protein
MPSLWPNFIWTTESWFPASNKSLCLICIKSPKICKLVWSSKSQKWQEITPFKHLIIFLWTANQGEHSCEKCKTDERKAKGVIFFICKLPPEDMQITRMALTQAYRSNRLSGWKVTTQMCIPAHYAERVTLFFCHFCQKCFSLFQEILKSVPQFVFPCDFQW